MQYFSEQGDSHREVVQRIRDKYGDRAKIMTHRNVRVGGFLGLFTRDGVEISGYISNEEPLRRRKELTDEKNRIIAAAAAAAPARVAVSSPVSAEKVSVPETKASPVKAGGNGDGTLTQVLSELRELKEKVAVSEPVETEEHESLRLMEDLLEKNDFSFKYIRDILKRIKRELSLEELEDFETLQQTVVEWIGETIEIHEEPRGQQVQADHSDRAHRSGEDHDHCKNGRHVRIG